MNFQLSSEKIGNPLLMDLLRKISKCFAEMNQVYFVIGATARDLIVRQLVGIASSRRTRDLDLAIAIPDWSAFDDITEALLARGLTKDLKMKQRFYDGDYELDLVPYGAVAKPDDHIYWPPEEDIAMSVKGFAEVLSDAITVSIDGAFDVKIASLHGLFILKFSAWMDRHMATRKDADDMEFIIRHYFFANLSRNPRPEVYDWKDFDEWIVGAYWLANDISRLLPVEQLRFYARRLEEEYRKSEQSHLMLQMLDANSALKFEQVYDGLSRMLQVWNGISQ
ncbi:MAG: nucleotidyltransferase [Tannerella sp.]|jgi:hypothetical protein|nr:MAG: nucleotidyltransferase [Tannerella sp.]